MSHIEINESDIEQIISILLDIKNNDINNDNIMNLIELLIPKKGNNNLVNYRLKEHGLGIAKFIPNYNSIDICLSKSATWLEKNSETFIDTNSNINNDEFKSYLLLYMLSHEIEHSYQYLMAKGEVESPNRMMKEAYAHLFDDVLIRKDYILPRFYTQTKRDVALLIYKSNENFFLLERNANIESMDFVSTLALINDRKEISDIFLNMKNLMSKIGYIKNSNGSIYETYNRLLLLNKYKKFHEEVNLPFEQRVRYGFKINEDERKLILQKSK